MLGVPVELERLSRCIQSGNFITQISQQLKHPEKRETLIQDSFLRDCVVFAKHVYGEVPNIMIPSGWTLMLNHHTENDLKAAIYQKGNSNRCVCAFAGTKTMRDWKENLKQIGGLSKQYEEAKDFASSFLDQCPNADVTFVGHSQGGGEAAYCAYLLGGDAITFNPAGVSNLTKPKSPKSSNIKSYIYWSDLLNMTQLLSEALPKAQLLDIIADGEIHLVMDYKPQKLSVSEWHGIDGFVRYFDLLPHIEENPIRYTPVSDRKSLDTQIVSNIKGGIRNVFENTKYNIGRGVHGLVEKMKINK